VDWDVAALAADVRSLDPVAYVVAIDLQPRRVLAGHVGWLEGRTTISLMSTCEGWESA
jgi:hypothetical protein